ncbi:MAG: hypothetical protein ACPLRA_03145, partial [Candidatus Saccharicenans sp.]
EHRGEAGLITRLEAFADEISQYQMPARKIKLTKKTADPENWPIEEIKKCPFILPYFADQAFAFTGALKKSGLKATVLPPPDNQSLELGEQYSSGKECHAFCFLLGDLLKQTLGQKLAEPTIFFFPGARYACLLQQYGPAMRNLLSELGQDKIYVLTPSLEFLWKLIGFEGLKSLWQGLVAVDNLINICCQLRPYENNKGEVDRVFQDGLRQIEEGIATDQLSESLERIRKNLRAIKIWREERPVIGIAGDIYTRQNAFANNQLFYQLEKLGCEVWPSPFLVDEIDFSFSRSFYEKLSEGNLIETVKYAGLNLVKEIKKIKVRKKLAPDDLRIKEPSYEDLVRSTVTYLNYNNNQSLFLNVAKMVDFARKGADGIINVICFNCLLGTTAAAISGRIKKDFQNIPLPTLIYGESEMTNSSSRLEAFVAQVQARFKNKKVKAVVKP